MSWPNSEQLTLRVSDKVLYVGSTTAYPLAGVVRVQWERYAPRNGRAIRTILSNLTAFGPLIFLANSLANPSTAYNPFVGIAEFSGIIEFILVVGCIVRCWEPARILWESRHPYYTLSINTAGSVSTQLGNPDGEHLAKVARMIIDAIDDPTANWQIPVINYHIGDNIHQSGPGSVAKATA